MIDTITANFIRLKPDEDLNEYLSSVGAYERFAITELEDGSALLTFLDLYEKEDAPNEQEIIIMTPQRTEFLMKQHKLHELLYMIEKGQA